MDVDFRPRRGGKTYSTIQWWLIEPSKRGVFCIDEREAVRVRQLSIEMCGTNPKYIEQVTVWAKQNIRSIHSQPLRGNSIDFKVVLDNADIILQLLFGNIDHVTWTDGSRV